MLDIFYINYELCSEKLGLLFLPKENLPKKGIFLRIFSLFKHFIASALSIKHAEYIKKDAILFFVMAQNEINSVKSIQAKIPSSHLFGIDCYKNGFPHTRLYFYSLVFIPVVIYRYLICKNKYHKESFFYAFDGFCLAYASRIVLKGYLLKVKPKKIIIANQLSCLHRSLAMIAKKLDIETVYIQHASVTENFSDLNIFSTALLEGEDSLMKFQANGTSNLDLYLIGMPKFDNYFNKIKGKIPPKVIGLCTNGMDDIEKYTELIHQLSEEFTNIEIIVRPHPADRRRQDWLKLATKFKAQFSDVRFTESFAFFETVDLIIAGDSNIHLEAVLLNIPTIYFDPLMQELDWYGFVKNDLIFYSADTKYVIKQIDVLTKNPHNIRYKAKFYVESVNTIFDGKSSELAALIIQRKQNSNIFNHDVDSHANNIFRLN